MALLICYGKPWILLAGQHPSCSSSRSDRDEGLLANSKENPRV
jgi:hypothetical protein